MTRIRYRRIGNVLQSNHMLANNSDVFYATINLITGLWGIHFASNDNMIYSGGSTTSALAKKAIKSQLREFGVAFGSEVRNRRPKAVVGQPSANGGVPTVEAAVDAAIAAVVAF